MYTICFQYPYISMIYQWTMSIWFYYGVTFNVNLGQTIIKRFLWMLVHTAHRYMSRSVYSYMFWQNMTNIFVIYFSGSIQHPTLYIWRPLPFSRKIRDPSIQHSHYHAWRSVRDEETHAISNDEIELVSEPDRSVTDMIIFNNKFWYA